MKPNNTRKKLKAGRPVIGAQLNIPSPDLMELFGYAGFDFVFVDCEHGAMGRETVTHMIRAGDLHGVSSIVRVPRNAPDVICSVLDAGAAGIVVPGVTTAADAERAVRAAKYSPQGMRGVGSGRGSAYGQRLPVKDLVSVVNEETMVVALLEDIAVLDHLDAILEVPGIDVFIVGPNDFSQSMGVVGRYDHPRFQESRNAVFDRVLKAGRVMGSAVKSLEDAETHLDRGFRWLHVPVPDMLVKASRGFVDGIVSHMKK